MYVCDRQLASHRWWNGKSNLTYNFSQNNSPEIFGELFYFYCRKFDEKVSFFLKIVERISDNDKIVKIQNVDTGDLFGVRGCISFLPELEAKS